ncbi:MAG TPA: zinc ribbon domain-containing protein [Trebonia sp.]
MGRVLLGDGEASRTASCRVMVRGGVDEKTGEMLSAAVVAERVGWCAGLVRGMAAGLLEDHWNAADVTALASGRDGAGRPLPGQAWMAARRLGWGVSTPAAVTVNDRITRMAQEQAGRLLRSAAWRAAITNAVLATWPRDPLKRGPEEWDAVRAAIPGGDRLPSSVIRARTRQVLRFRAAGGLLPQDVFDLESPPSATGVLLLAACDRQQATIERSGAGPRRALLRLQLPARPDPRSHRDWAWVALPLQLPPTVPPGAVLHLPAVRTAGGRTRADLAFTSVVPAARRDGHVVALGVDWGLSTLLSAGAARLNGDLTITVLGAGGQYRARGVLARAHRLRRHAEQLHAKASHYERLIAGRDPHPLTAKAAILLEELRRVSERRSNLNDALAWSAARWTVDQAITAGATVIYVEDLRSMEARGMGRTMNVRLSQAVRGKIMERMRHLASEHGIAVVTVPARNTSKHCPRCLAPLRHCKAPDKPHAPGRKWAICPGCGWQGDRDTGAWQRIAARGLAHQTRTFTDRDTRAMSVRVINDALESRAVITPQTAGRDRSKAGPTRKQFSRPAPRRRGAPSPPPRPGGGQRPEGHATTAQRILLPRAADRRDQDAHAIGTTPVRRPHRARGAALGAGFHLNAHATPPRWGDDPRTHKGR